MSLIGREQIEAILPHRPPFLFVDEITEIVPAERIVGEFLVKEDELFLARESSGVYLPQSVLAEAMAQVGAILVLHPEENRGRTIYFRSIEEAEFYHRVPVGSRIRVEARVKKLRSRFGSLAVEAYLDSEVAAKAVMSFALG